MQIHAGNLKGRRIKTVKNAPYRPTTAIVRKSLFDILRDIEDKSFLDLFSGTGIIGFEAISRGARHVTFVEKSIRANALLKINHSLLGLTRDICTIKKIDAYTFLNKNLKYDIIFADPPYFLSNDGITCQSGKMVKVNKGKWDKGMSTEDIHEFNKLWLEKCKRILKPNGTIFVSGTSHNIYSVGFGLQELNYKIINDISWFKEGRG